MTSARLMGIAPGGAVPSGAGAGPEPLLRTLLGSALRRERISQHRTLRDVSASARVSLGYLSEIERGQKEASSELLAAICSSLRLGLIDILRTVLIEPAGAESARVGYAAMPLRPAIGAPPARPLVVDRAA